MANDDDHVFQCNHISFHFNGGVIFFGINKTGSRASKTLRSSPSHESASNRTFDDRVHPTSQTDLHRKLRLSLSQLRGTVLQQDRILFRETVDESTPQKTANVDYINTKKNSFGTALLYRIATAQRRCSQQQTLLQTFFSYAIHNQIKIITKATFTIYHGAIERDTNVILYTFRPTA
jgi:hypothetical protein